MLPRLSLSARPMATPQVPITAMMDAVLIPIVASAVMRTIIFRITSTSAATKLTIASSRLARLSRTALSIFLTTQHITSPTTSMIAPKSIPQPAFLKKSTIFCPKFSIVHSAMFIVGALRHNIMIIPHSRRVIKKFRAYAEMCARAAARRDRGRHSRSPSRAQKAAHCCARYCARDLKMV